MFDQQGDQPDEGVQSVETLGSHQGGAVVLLGQSAVAEIHTHLSRHPEEPGDQVVSLQQAVQVHLLHKYGEGLGGVFASCR